MSTFKLVASALFFTLVLALPGWAADENGSVSETSQEKMKAAPSAEGGEHTGTEPSAMDHSKMDAAEKKEAQGTGVINTIDIDNKSINLTHDPMPEFGWPTMTMDLPATKKVDLSSVKAGDKVTFTLKRGMDKKYRVIDVKPVQ